MAEFIIGAVIMASLWMVVSVARRKNLRVPIWGWFLTLIGFGYVTFVAMVLLAFYREEQFQALLPMGGLLAFPALVFTVFLYRFAFARTVQSARTARQE